MKINMICFDCVLKHLSAALSYGKQILTGHGKDADLDHRIDFLGQLVNAEHHLSVMNQFLYKKVSELRKTVQAEDLTPTFEDLQSIRQIFKLVDKRPETDKTKEQKDLIDFNPDVIYYSVSNSDYADFSQSTLKKYLKDYNRIFRVSSEQTLDQILNQSDLTKTVLFVPQNFIMLKEFSARRFQVFFSYSDKKIYDGLTAELVQTDKFKQIFADKDYTECLTRYFSINKPTTENLAERFCKGVDKHICCSLKKALEQQSFTYWINLDGYQALKKYLNFNS